MYNKTPHQLHALPPLRRTMFSSPLQLSKRTLLLIALAIVALIIYYFMVVRPRERKAAEHLVNRTSVAHMAESHGGATTTANTTPSNVSTSPAQAQTQAQTESHSTAHDDADGNDASRKQYDVSRPEPAAQSDGSSQHPQQKPASGQRPADAQSEQHTSPPHSQHGAKSATSNNGERKTARPGQNTSSSSTSEKTASAAAAGKAASMTTSPHEEEGASGDYDDQKQMGDEPYQDEEVDDEQAEDDPQGEEHEGQ